MRIDPNRLARIERDFTGKVSASRDALQRAHSLKSDLAHVRHALGETYDPVQGKKKPSKSETERLTARKAEIEAALRMAYAEYEIASQEADVAGNFAREAREFAERHGFSVK